MTKNTVWKKFAQQNSSLFSRSTFKVSTFEFTTDQFLEKSSINCLLSYIAAYRRPFDLWRASLSNGVKIGQQRNAADLCSAIQRKIEFCQLQKLTTVLETAARQSHQSDLRLWSKLRRLFWKRKWQCILFSFSSLVSSLLSLDRCKSGQTQCAHKTQTYIKKNPMKFIVINKKMTPHMFLYQPARNTI